MDKYLQALRTDAAETKEYLRKSVGTKTQQQLRLEAILSPLLLKPRLVADVACGAGGLSYHLSAMYPEARFTLADLNDDALELARMVGNEFGADVVKEDALQLSFPSDLFDLVFCWQTLSWISDPARCLSELT